MMDMINNPHDTFVRHSFENPRVLQDFCANYLPADLAGKIRLDQVRLEHDSFVDEGLKEHLSDLLIYAPLKESGNTRIYVLFEHKSSSERFVMLQLLRYMVQIWEKERAAQKTTSGFYLTPIVPLILHHGRNPMTASVEFCSLVRAIPGLEGYAPRFSAHLVDLSVIQEGVLRGGVRLMAVMTLLQMIFSKELNEKLPEILKTLNEISSQPDVASMIRTILFYALNGSDEVTEETIEKAIRNVKNGDEIMNAIAQKWVKQGLEQGLERGERKEARAIVLKAIEARFKKVPGKLKKYIEATTDLVVLEGLIPLVISCETIEEFQKQVGV